MHLFKPKGWRAAAAGAFILASVIAVSPSATGVASAATCSGSGLYNWYLQNSNRYSVMESTVNNDYMALNPTQIDGNVNWEFCRIGTENGDPMFTLVVNLSYGGVHIGQCAADAGNVEESGNATYFTFQPCSANGTDFIEVPLSGGGFRLQSWYQLRTTGRAEYITTTGPGTNSPLVLAEAGTWWQAWNGSPCNSIISC